VKNFCNTNVGGVATMLQFPFPSCTMLHKWEHNKVPGFDPRISRQLPYLSLTNHPSHHIGDRMKKEKDFIFLI
jgi:hypothetical protein